jgi:hypothetical protein
MEAPRTLRLLPETPDLQVAMIEALETLTVYPAVGLPPFDFSLFRLRIPGLFNNLLVRLCQIVDFPTGYLLLLRPVSTSRETASPGGVYSTGQVRDLAWTRPFDAVSRLSHETRRSNGSPDQQVSGRSIAA